MMNHFRRSICAVFIMSGVCFQTASAQQLSQNEISAFTAKLMANWLPPENAKDKIVVRIRISRDGRLNGGPQILSTGSGLLFERTRDSAVRAVFQSQPFTMFNANTYDAWKAIDMTFDPSEAGRQKALRDAVPRQALEQARVRQRIAEAKSKPVSSSGPYSSEVLECVKQFFPKTGFSAFGVQGTPCSDFLRIDNVETIDSRDIPSGIEVMTQITFEAMQSLNGGSLIAAACGTAGSNLESGSRVKIQTRVPLEKWNSGLKCTLSHW